MRAKHCTLLVLLAVTASCSAHKRRIRYPESVVENPKNRKKSREHAKQPYVIKMSDGKHTWQVEIPVGPGTPSFRAAIPLDLGGLPLDPPLAGQTEADREIIDAKRAAGEPVTEAELGRERKSRSYLATIARVRELYKRRQYEMALMDLVSIDRDYPDDERILEMKGSVYLKLNRPKEARKAWERVLTLNPDNQVVATALERLTEEEK